MKIGIQGAIGSFSEEASKKFIENHGIKNPEIKYLISSEDVLTSVENRKVDYGIFAMENAQGGVVIESVEALALHKCKIIEMFHIPIEQNLLTLLASPSFVWLSVCSTPCTGSPFPWLT